ncbi:MAG: UDP-N-acetylmuramoyl-tripeptide--D-alanyl-D-alanine ligase [Clostridia bacterium]|nr:UDP-N-acetylmuramoyl-tripeptide--D-alanyl-D-alanine ligase [Clostridia bacterium]
MNEKIYIAICIIAAIIPFFSSYRQLQMLQQNSYFPSRYMKWVYDSFFTPFTGLTIVFCALSIIIRFNYVIDLIIVCALLLIHIADLILTYKKSIKKLVFTARIQRILICQTVIILAALLFAINTTNIAKGICFSILLLLSVFSPLLTLIDWAVTWPIEKMFNLYYKYDAEEKIDACKGLTVIGVTGSYGKTSTKFILARLLSEKYNVLTTPLSYNTTLGVVKTVRNDLRAHHEVFICEMGAKNIGDIKEICDVVKPQMGLITSVGPQHLETFKTTQNVFNTKFELYDAVKNKNGDIFVNADSEPIANGIEHKECIAYGTEGTMYYAENIRYSKNGSTFTLVLETEKIEVTTRLLGHHNVVNIVGAAAIAYKMGVTPEQIKFAISRLEPTEHRLEIKSSVAGSTMLDDAYNANPEGCIEAVKVLSHFEGMQKVIITPGLVELGDQEYDFNYKLGLAAASVCDIIILVGKKRSVPFTDAIATTDFDSEKVFVAGSFMEAMSIYSRFADKNTVVLVENDLPDNYLN